MRTLPEHVSLLGLLPAQASACAAPVAAVGLAEDELEPLLVDLRDGPHFAITGPPRGGKSTVVRTWLLSLRGSIAADRLQLYVADLSRDGLADFGDLPEVRAINNGQELPTLLASRRSSRNPTCRSSSTPR